MDTALKLATDYAEQYASPELSKLPKWAVWQQKAYGTTYEPVVFIYNKRLIPQGMSRIRTPRWQNWSPRRRINSKAK
jgi:ABC-type Fe3+ transport system substrate-binding protein